MTLAPSQPGSTPNVNDNWKCVGLGSCGQKNSLDLTVSLFSNFDGTSFMHIVWVVQNALRSMDVDLDGNSGVSAIIKGGKEDLSIPKSFDKKFALKQTYKPGVTAYT